VIDGLLDDLRGPRPAQAQVDDLGAMIGGPADAVGHGRGRAGAPPIEHLHGHQLGVERHACGPDAVVRRLRDRASDVGAVALIVVGVLGLVHEVEARHALRVGEVCPLRERPVVLAGDAGIDHGHHGAAARREVPCGGRPDAIEVPLVLQQRIVRNEKSVDPCERLCVLDPAVVVELVEQISDPPGGNLGNLDACLFLERRGREGDAEHVGQHRFDVARPHAVAEVDDDLTWDVLARLEGARGHLGRALLPGLARRGRRAAGEERRGCGQQQRSACQAPEPV
jgi:hypothetical protein